MFERLLPNAAATYNHANGENQNALATQMGFSPDMESTMIRGGKGEHKVIIINVLGYIPGISTVTGAYRFLVGLAYLVKSAVCAIFDAANRAQHIEGMKIAAANIGRGFLEMIPVVGNLFTINIDASRMLHRWSEFKGTSYIDPNTVPIFKAIDGIGAIPVVGTVTNAVRVVFFTFHTLVNVPMALTGNPRYCNALKHSVTQIGIGLVEMIPLIGSVSYFCRVTIPQSMTGTYSYEC